MQQVTGQRAHNSFEFCRSLCNYRTDKRKRTCIKVRTKIIHAMSAGNTDRLIPRPGNSSFWSRFKYSRPSSSARFPLKQTAVSYHDSTTPSLCLPLRVSSKIALANASISCLSFGTGSHLQTYEQSLSPGSASGSSETTVRSPSAFFCSSIQSRSGLCIILFSSDIFLPIDFVAYSE